MIRKSIAFLLALALLLCGTACGNKADTPADSNTDPKPSETVTSSNYTLDDYLNAIDKGDYETVLVWLAQYADTDILTDERIVDFLDKIAILPVEDYRNGEHILFSYDEKGHLIQREVSYSTDGEERHRTYEYPHDAYGNLIDEDIVREYDENGNVTKETHTDKNNSYEILYSYNDKNQLVREERTYEGFEPIVYTYTYHANGRIASKTSASSSETYNENGQLLTECDSYSDLIYTYNESGRLLSQEYKVKDEDSPSHCKATFTYDEKDRLLNYRSESLSDSTVSETAYTYYTYNGTDYVQTSKYTNENGEVSETIYTYDKDRLTSEKNETLGSETAYTYNEDDRLLNKKIYRNGEMSSEAAYTYQDGKLISITETRNNGNVTEYTYTYNESGDIATISEGPLTYNGYGVFTSLINEEYDIRCTYRVMYYPDGVPECLETPYFCVATYGILYDLELYRGLPQTTADTVLPEIRTYTDADGSASVIY